MHKGDFSTSDTVPFYFTSNDSSGGAVTLTGLALADIKIYKDGSVTQRSSTAGFTLVDTDGIDVDGVTGFHGFTVDLSDNTDAGFYSSGSFYTVLIDSVTVDSQTVRFIAGTFSIGMANIAFWNNEAIPATSVTGRPLVDVRNVDGAAHNLARATDLATVDTNVDSILADTGTDGVLISMAQALPGSPTADTVGDALKQATREEAPKKNVALNDIPFYMVDSTDHVTPETGLSVTAEVSKDGAAFAGAAGSVTEIGSGVYHFDATQADMNADVIVFKFTAAGADPQVVAMSTVE